MEYRCMSPEELADWRDLNRQTGPARVSGPCADCSLAYAADMREEGRCDGRPHGWPDPEVEEKWYFPTRPFWTPVGVRRSAEVRHARKAEQAAKAAELREQGLTRKQIGDLLGVGVWTVGEYLRMRAA